MQKRIKLSKIKQDDPPRLIFQLLFHEEVMTMNMGRIFTQAEADEYLSFLLQYNAAHDITGAFHIFTMDDIFVGMASIVKDGDSAEVEYMLLPPFWNQGYGTEIVQQLLETARKDRSIKRVLGYTDPKNIPSQRVLLKNGFTKTEMRIVEEDNSSVAVYSIVI